MSSRRPAFTCTACGATHSKWSGRCDACGAWNTIAEEAPLAEGPRGARSAPPAAAASRSPTSPSPSRPSPAPSPASPSSTASSAAASSPPRPSSSAATPASASPPSSCRPPPPSPPGGQPAVYISGEEATAQIRLRAARLGLANAPLKLATETNLRDILATLEAERPALAVIDSIQTMWSDHVDSAPGSVSQVRAAAHELVAFAKRRGTAIVLVGHVTKDGQIAGPRVVEHMVDTVLYFEGERGHQFRILRAVKNRFGPADEIGVFEMTGQRPRRGRRTPPPSSSPSATPRPPAPPSSPASRAPARSSSRSRPSSPPPPPAPPRRTVVGWDAGRLAMLLAVLESRCGIAFGPSDVYLNVAGGLRITEPAADLAVAAALVSARQDIPLPRDAVVFGEISLSGALRPAAAVRRPPARGGKARLHRRLHARPAPAGNDLAIHPVADLAAFMDKCFGTIER